MTTTPAGFVHDGTLARRDRSALSAGSSNSVDRDLVVVLATAHSGAGRLRELLDRLPDLTCTSGTGILPLCEQALAAWSNADGRPGRAPSALAISSTRALAGVIITSVLARAGKQRWCEISTAMPEAAEAFLRLYPTTKFICLYRSCSDVIRAVLDASPWGIADAAFAPFIRMHPASTASALAAYWAGHTESLLAFEQSHPQAVLRIRFEDLAAAEQQVARAVTTYLGIASLDGGPMPAHDSQDPALPGINHAETGHPEASLPAGLISPAILARANDLLRQLGYPALPE